MTNSQTHRRQIANVAISSVFAIAAFARGWYLLGNVVAFFYALIAITTTWFVARPYGDMSRNHRLRHLPRLVFGIFVAFAMAFPATVSPGLSWDIDNHIEQRRIRTELQSIFAATPEFSRLKVSTSRRKIICVDVSGTLPSMQQLKRLRADMMDHSIELDRYWLHWEIQLIDTGEVINSSDRELFLDSDKKA